MKLHMFSSRTDDFAEVAADPKRRHATIDRLSGLRRWLDWSSLLFILVTLLQTFEHSFGAVCTGLLAAILIGGAAQIKSDVHLLQVMGDLHDKPSA